MPAALTADELADNLATRDLTDPAQGPHAMQLLLDRVVEAVAAVGEPEILIRRGERVVTIADNYDNLGYPAADITRDNRYTRYVDDHRMLRSHSTALVPGALRALAAGPARDEVLLVCPGIVYRRDAIDRLHAATPHQVDLWWLSRRTPPMTGADLDAVIDALLSTLPSRMDSRVRVRRHTYTTGGRQVDVARAGEWIEVAECGLANPAVLAMAGLDSAWNGVAMGVGLDRMLMLVKNIPDIRVLRSPNPAVTAQMTDLSPYRPVSTMPPITRDLSIAVDADDSAEDLGDRVRQALGDQAAIVESVAVLLETPCAELPDQALARLGASREQKNLLVRVVFRHLERSVPAAEANELRDRVYAALHRGRDDS